MFAINLNSSLCNNSKNAEFNHLNRILLINLVLFFNECKNGSDVLYKMYCANQGASVGMAGKFILALFLFDSLVLN